MNNPFNLDNIDPKVKKKYAPLNQYDLFNKASYDTLQGLIESGCYDGYGLCFYEPVNGLNEPWELREKESE